MIEGYFGIEDELFFEIELIANDGLELTVDALLDTGFSGWLAMNRQDIEGLDWSYLQQQEMTTARGDTYFDLYLGTVRINGEYFDIPVHIGEEVTEFLLGRKWLKSRRLLVDMPSGILTLYDEN